MLAPVRCCFDVMFLLFASLRFSLLGGVHTRSEIAKRSEQIPEKQYVRSSSLLL